MNRRKFIQTTGIAAATTALPGWYLEESLAQGSLSKPKLANDRLGVALVGCGGRGRGVAEAAFLSPNTPQC